VEFAEPIGHTVAGNGWNRREIFVVGLSRKSPDTLCRRHENGDHKGYTDYATASFVPA
jgi:hypothetical protein